MRDVADRERELAARLADVRARIGRACSAAGRDSSGVTLVAVSKGFPAADAALMAGRLGVPDLGESRDQEAAPKARALAAMGLVDPSVRWHFVGRLQRNKCPSVATYAAVVHGVDRLDLVASLDRAAERADREVTALIQVSLDGDPARGGAEAGAVPALADAIAAADHLRLGGVMAVAPRAMDPDAAFGSLAAIHHEVVLRHPSATIVSAGMSGDLESAIRHGATCLRVGSALFGVRAPLVG